MVEYIYVTNEPLVNEYGEIFLARESIVRCRDCKEYHPELYQHISCELLVCYVKPNGFCSMGERRDDA